MRITKVDIPKSSVKDGLEEIKLDKLSSIVLIAGKNGSGKTRILNKIFKKLNKEILTNIMHYFTVKQYIIRENIFKEGEKAEFIYFIRSGEIEVTLIIYYTNSNR